MNPSYKCPGRAVVVVVSLEDLTDLGRWVDMAVFVRMVCVCVCVCDRKRKREREDVEGVCEFDERKRAMVKTQRTNMNLLLWCCTSDDCGY